MRLTSTVAVAAGLWLTLTGAVMAQDVDSGSEVQVNPIAAGGGVVLYPGGEYSWVLSPLLYPGERGGLIHLHMPSRHHRALASAAPLTAALAAKPKRVTTPKRVASAEPRPVSAPAPNSNPYGGATDLSNVFGNAPKPPPTAPAGPPQDNANLTKRSVILFAKDAPDPARGALGAIKFLAGDLNASMTGPGARIELQAFGGAHGDKGSDARRLSLKRALAIRQVLIDDGVSADRIDVRAMGGTDDTGPADRVDVYIRA